MSNCSILVVDDDRDLARSLARLLVRQGHKVRLAYDGIEAVDQARLHPPDVVLLDIGLPGQNGYHVAERLRREAACDGCSIIAISGYCREEDQRRTREAGFDDFLAKPVDYDGLVSVISQAGSRTASITASRGGATHGTESAAMVMKPLLSRPDI